jgi:hypothetical protein
MAVEGYAIRKTADSGVRLREKGGKRHAMPCHHNFEEYLIADRRRRPARRPDRRRSTAPASSLGVDRFGQSGDIPDLYRAYGIDTDAILDAAARACLTALRQPE